MASLFYPSHDIALANGVRHFNPPAAALRLQEDLASLHHIWNHPFEAGEVAIPQPWGWDWDTRQHIHKEYGIKLSQLPTDEELAAIRELSSRKTTIDLLTRLIHRLGQASGLESWHEVPFTFPMPQYLETMEAVETFIMQHEADGRPFVLKTPWSSSGRGLMRSTAPRNAIMRHAQATLQRMGGIMAEEWIDDKVQDFAMLFYVSDHDVRFLGYSLFDNEGTTYRQGYLSSNEQIMSRLNVSARLLSEISDAYTHILTHLFRPFFGRPWHLGYAGIDMMTYGSGLVAPCVEMNLRCTMGVVCRLWFDQHNEEGIFRISPMEENGHFEAKFITQL